MSKTALTITIAVLALGAGTASAQSQSQSFTLKQAHHVAKLYVNYPHATVKGCHFAKRGDAAYCHGTLGPMVLVDGTQPVTFKYTLFIARSGACPLPVTKRTGPHSGISSGVIGDNYSNGCDNGPLAPVMTRLAQTS